MNKPQLIALFNTVSKICTIECDEAIIVWVCYIWLCSMYFIWLVQMFQRRPLLTQVIHLWWYWWLWRSVWWTELL